MAFLTENVWSMSQLNHTCGEGVLSPFNGHPTLWNGLSNWEPMVNILVDPHLWRKCPEDPAPSSATKSSPAPGEDPPQ